MGNEAFEDVFPIENGDFPASYVWLQLLNLKLHPLIIPSQNVTFTNDDFLGVSPAH